MVQDPVLDQLPRLLLVFVMENLVTTAFKWLWNNPTLVIVLHWKTITRHTFKLNDSGEYRTQNLRLIPCMLMF